MKTSKFILSAICLSLLFGIAINVSESPAIVSAQAAGPSPASVFYDFDVVAKSGDVGISVFGIGPSINDKGRVAMTGFFRSQSALFVGDGSALPINVTPNASRPNRFFSSFVQMNNSDRVIGWYQEPVGNNDFSSVIRPFDGNGSTEFDNVAVARLFAKSPIFDFEYLLSRPSINNNNQSAFAAAFGQDDLRFICNGQCLVTPSPGTGFNI